MTVKWLKQDVIAKVQEAMTAPIEMPGQVEPTNVLQQLMSAKQNINQQVK